MKLLLLCSLFLFQTLYAETSAMVSAKLAVRQKGKELHLQERKVRACTAKVEELHESVSEVSTELSLKTIKVKELKAQIVEENGMLAVCQQKLGIAEELETQSEAIAYDLMHKNKDTQKLLQAKIADLTAKMEDAQLEIAHLAAVIETKKAERDHENDKGDELDGRVTALNKNMQTTLDALKQAQADKQEEQEKAIERSIRRLRTYVQKWDATEAEAQKLESELEKLEELLTRLNSVALMLAIEFQNTKLVLYNTNDGILGLDVDLEWSPLDGHDMISLDDNMKTVSEIIDAHAAKSTTKKPKKKSTKKKSSKKKKSTKKKPSVKRRLAEEKADETDVDDILNMVPSVEDIQEIINLSVPSDEVDDNEDDGPSGVSKTKTVLYTEGSPGNRVAISLEKSPIQFGTTEYSFVKIPADPLQYISSVVAEFREKIGVQVSLLSTCRTDVVSQSSQLNKLKSNLEAEIHELECAMKEIKVAMTGVETCNIKLKEVQAQIDLSEENNKALAAQVDSDKGALVAALKVLRELRGGNHELELDISGKHGQINDLEHEIQDEIDHESVVIKMISNIEATISNINDKINLLQTESGCPPLEEQINDQKLVLVKGALEESKERVLNAQVNIERVKGEIEAQEAFCGAAMAKINNLRQEIVAFGSEAFGQELKMSMDADETLGLKLAAVQSKIEAEEDVLCVGCEKIKAFKAEQEKEGKVGTGVEDVVPFYKNQWTWLLMTLSFAGGYIGYGYKNKSADNYQRFLGNEVAMEKI